MGWKFDPFQVDIVWVSHAETIMELAEINFGEGSDLSIDIGDRTNELGDIDQGLRVLDGDI